MAKTRLHTPLSALPDTQRVRLFAYEKGVEGEIEEVVLDMAPGGEQRGWHHPVNATPLDERFERVDGFWKRWQGRRSSKRAHADRSSGIPELDQLKAA